MTKGAVWRLVLGLTCVVFAGGLYWALWQSGGSRTETAIVALGLLGTLASFYFFIATITKYPRSVTIALLGLAGSGKTFFLAALARGSYRNISSKTRFYFPDNVDGHPAKLRDVPAPTPPSFYYAHDAFAMRGKKPSRLQFVDYGGNDFRRDTALPEVYREIQIQVRQSDALMLFVEAPVMAGERLEDALEYQGRIVSLLHDVIEVSSGNAGGSVNKPLALIFTKCDLLEDHRREMVLTRSSFILDICKARFLSFEHFFVSAGEVREGSYFQWKPVGVYEPLLWLLGE